MTTATSTVEIGERAGRAAETAALWVGAHVGPLVLVSQLVIRLRDSLGPEGSSAVAYAVLFPLVAALEGATVASIGWRGVRWAICSLISLTFAMAIGVVVMATAEGHQSETLWMHGAWLLAGLVQGIGQWFEARRVLVRPARWIAASTLGWLGGAAAWSLLWMWRESLSRFGPLRAVLGGLDLPGNIELSMIAVTFVVYAACTAPLVALAALRSDRA
jgi:phage shock protein PspC (stress-responsive transcriptional regulator)